MTQAPTPGPLSGDYSVEEYVAEYEFRGDEGSHTPNDDERALITDAIHGYLSEASYRLAPTAPVEASGSEREAVARALGSQRGHPDPWPTDFYDADAALKALLSARPLALGGQQGSGEESQ